MSSIKKINNMSIKPVSFGKYEKLPPQQDNSKSVGEHAFDAIQLIGEVLFVLLKTIWLFLEYFYRIIVPVPEKSVKNEIVLITGTGHGIGRQLALNYAAQGATVVCWDINENTNNETILEIIKLGYTNAHAYKCNVASRANILEVAKKVQKEVGEVTILINNAGIMPCHPFMDHTTEEIEAIININVMAHFWLLQAFLPKMIENNHGHIVALSSCAGIMGLRNLVPYCASKFAVRGMMEALYHEFKANPKNQIKFTTIYPYMVDTGLCKRPKIKFPSLLPILNPKQVANHIMSAQRRNVLELSLPPSIYNLNSYVRLHPPKIGELLNDFMDTYVESDL